MLTRDPPEDPVTAATAAVADTKVSDSASQATVPGHVAPSRGIVDTSGRMNAEVPAAIATVNGAGASPLIVGSTTDKPPVAGLLPTVTSWRTTDPMWNGFAISETSNSQSFVSRSRSTSESDTAPGVDRRMW